ncbi:MAG: MarR family transcriptional regulator [Ktedonobacterales bacterium]|nr:MarR family transcriptional regulator [Ktedonobacterales bacterium]
MHEPQTPDPLTKDALVETAFNAQRLLSRTLHAMNAPEWQTVDLTMPQMKALMILDTDGALSIGELACRLNFGKPAMSILVEKLVQGGYLQRADDPEDRRRAIVRVSEKGADIVATLLRGTHTKLRHYLSQMEHADLVALVQGLGAMVAMITRDMPESDPCAPTTTNAARTSTTLTTATKTRKH